MTVDPTLISVAHWGRLSDGELLAHSQYVEWAVLMKRTWGAHRAHLPALSARDANADALLDLFDFASRPRLLAPPPAPPAGRNGCRPAAVAHR